MFRSFANLLSLQEYDHLISQVKNRKDLCRLSRNPDSYVFYRFFKTGITKTGYSAIRSHWIGRLFRIRSISNAEDLNCKMLDLCKELKIDNDPNYISNLLKLLMKEPLHELSIILEFMTDITDVEEWFNIC